MLSKYTLKMDHFQWHYTVFGQNTGENITFYPAISECMNTMRMQGSCGLGMFKFPSTTCSANFNVT